MPNKYIQNKSKPHPTTAHRSPSKRANPRPALIRRTVPSAARPNILAIAVAVAIGGHAHPLAADARDGRGGPDEDLVDARRRDAACEGGVTIDLELALVVGVVVGGIDDVDGDVVVCVKVGC